MKTIWKFEFLTEGLRGLDLPKGSEILTVQLQQGLPCIWALVDPSQPKEKRIFVIHGTGHPIVQPESKRYIGTYQERGGIFVWHLFEIVEGVSGRKICEAGYRVSDHVGT